VLRGQLNDAKWSAHRKSLETTGLGPMRPFIRVGKQRDNNHFRELTNFYFARCEQDPIEILNSVKACLDQAFQKLEDKDYTRDQVSISSTFYEQLLRAQIPRAQKTDDLTVFFALLRYVRIKAAR